VHQNCNASDVSDVIDSVMTTSGRKSYSVEGPEGTLIQGGSHGFSVRYPAQPISNSADEESNPGRDIQQETVNGEESMVEYEGSDDFYRSVTSLSSSDSQLRRSGHWMN